MSDEKVTKIYLVRHGESIGNVLGSYYSSPEHKKVLRDLYPKEEEFPLTSRGLQQAKSAGEFLCSKLSVGDGQRDELFVYSSYMVRSMQTMLAAGKLFADRYVQNNITSEHLREKFTGPSLYMSSNEFHGQYPKVRQEYLLNRYIFVPPDGESLHSREIPFVEMLGDMRSRHLSSRNRSQRVVCFTHGGVMMAAERLATGIGLDEAKQLKTPDNCAVYEFDLTQLSFALVAKHDTQNF